MLLTALTALAAACSSGGSEAAPNVTIPGRTVSPPPSASPRPTAAGVVASREVWKLPAPVSRPVVLPVHGGFVVLGGLATGDVSTSRIVQVDVAGGSSQITGHLAVAVHDSAGAVIGGRFLVFGGGSFSTVSAVQSWTSGLATEVAKLPEARSDLSAVTLNRTSYLVGGFDGSAMTPDVLATTDGVSFRPVARLTVPVRYAAVANRRHLPVGDWRRNEHHRRGHGGDRRRAAYRPLHRAGQRHGSTPLPGRSCHRPDAGR